MIKLHLGCGWRNFGSEWTHVDGGDYDHLDAHDITKLDFEDDSVDLIYASHVLEYFDREEVKSVLHEWIRVLKPGGTLRVAVPNFRSMVVLYLNKRYDLETFLGPLYGKMQMGNDTIYHKTVYDLKSMTTLLTELGLIEVKPYKWQETEHAHHDDHSQAYIPHMDKGRGRLISLNVEGTKA